MTYIDIGDAELWVEDDGDEGVPLILMHPAAGHSGCWAEQRPRFAAAGFRVIAYDLRGFGRTRTAGAHEASGSLAADLEALVRSLKLPRFCLLGTAYGAFGAIEYALDNPDSLRALVISTSFGGLTDPVFTAIRAQHVRPDLREIPTVERELGDTYRASNPEGVRRWREMEQDSYKGDGARQSLRTPTTLARLESMRVPTVVVAGEEDAYAPPPVMRAFADHIPGAEFEVIAGAGHSAYWEEPDVWNEVVCRFLKEHV
jgi:3-oxoadipate enol-lactonase